MSYFSIQNVGHRIKFCVELKSSTQEPEGFSDLDLGYLLHALKVTSSKSALQKLLFEIVENLAKE
jgi:hypothetical protein